MTLPILLIRQTNGFANYGRLRAKGKIEGPRDVRMSKVRKQKKFRRLVLILEHMQVQKCVRTWCPEE